MYDWFAEKVLPTILIALVLAMVNMYVEFTSEKQATIAYRQSTDDIRDQEKRVEAKQWDFITKNNEHVVRLQEKCVTKTKFYAHIISECSK